MTPNTRGYWIRTIRGWGEDRLSDPQFAELDAVITWYEDSAGERDELKDENAKLRRQRDELAKELKNMLHVFDRGLHSDTIGRKVCDKAREALAKYNAVTGVTQEDSDER